MLVLMSLYMLQARLHSFVLPFVCPCAYAASVNQALGSLSFGFVLERNHGYIVLEWTVYMTFLSFLKLLSIQRTFHQWLNAKPNPWSLTSLQFTSSCERWNAHGDVEQCSRWRSRTMKQKWRHLLGGFLGGGGFWILGLWNSISWWNSHLHDTLKLWTEVLLMYFLTARKRRWRVLHLIKSC